MMSKFEIIQWTAAPISHRLHGIVQYTSYVTDTYRRLLILSQTHYIHLRICLFCHRRISQISSYMPLMPQIHITDREEYLVS